MAAAIRCSLLTITLLLVALAANIQMITAAANCSAGLSSLSVCAPFVVPGASTGPPSSGCCSALQGVDHDCLCSTIDIIQRLPSTCKLPQVTCGAN